jgi:hypothetical protein
VITMFLTGAVLGEPDWERTFVEDGDRDVLLWRIFLERDRLCNGM